MYKKINIVIGANYGDEGKGLITDKLCWENRDLKTINVLFNGGPQRGHTVELLEGSVKRHVFHHLGSGTFCNADTYLDEDFLIEPFTLLKECSKFRNVRIYASPKCRVITPYDIGLNVAREINDGYRRAGSCGYGVWETINRHEISSFNLRLGDMLKLRRKDFIEYLADMKHDYAKERMKSYYQPLNDYFDIRPEETCRMIMAAAKKIQIIDNAYELFADIYDHIIFEGGQGLLLDKDNKSEGRHVTSSNTGARVPIERMSEYISTVKPDIHYVTRSYLTRHGNGNLEGELPREQVTQNIDETNVYNEFQGHIRYAPLDINQVKERIRKDACTACKTPLNIFLNVTQADRCETVKENDLTINYISKRAFH